MDWLEVEVRALEGAQEAAALLLTEQGCQGVVIEDPRLIEELRAKGGWELCDIPPQRELGRVKVRAYYPLDGGEQERLAAIGAGLQAMEERSGPCCWADTAYRRVKDEDWAECWKQYFHVTKVGRQLVIQPSWEEYSPLSGEKVIHIDPGLAFGTGGHYTTRLCMARIEELLAARPQALVLDIGTGSGILALTAALCGARQVQAVDIDPLAVRVARENVAANRLEGLISVRQGELLQGTSGQADLIIANILAPVIIQLLPQLPARLAPGGLFLASGIITDQREAVEAAARQAGLRTLQAEEAGGWLALTMEMSHELP